MYIELGSLFTMAIMYPIIWYVAHDLGYKNGVRSAEMKAEWEKRSNSNAY